MTTSFVKYLSDQVLEVGCNFAHLIIMIIMSFSVYVYFSIVPNLSATRLMMMVAMVLSILSVALGCCL